MTLELIELLLPEGFCEYFNLIRVEKLDNSYHIYLEEKNIHPVEYADMKLESKGFFEEESIRDFPLRGKPCFLFLKRRKWFNHDTGKIVYRSWNKVASGTRMTSEFAFFLKGAFR